MTVPVSVDSNITGLAIAEELSLKLLPGTLGDESAAAWFDLEPNSYADFGATFKSVARETINATRQRLKGTTTDEDAKAGFNVDLTQRNLTRALQGFFFADAFEKPATKPLNGAQVVITAVTTGPNTFTAATGLAGFKVGSLVKSKGFGNSGNNRVSRLSAVAAGVLTTLDALIAEGGPPAMAELETVGFRCAAGDLHIAIAGANVNLSSTALDFTTLALHVGEWIFLGGDTALTRFVTSAGANVNVGFGRVLSIAAHLLVLDLTSFTPAADADGGGLQTVDIYFGKNIQNANTPGLVKRRTYQLERTMGNDGVGTQAEYLVGVDADQLTLNLPIASKVSLDLTFIGLDVQERSGTTGPKAGTHSGLPGEAPFNTSHDIYLSRLAIVDPTTLNPLPLYGFASDIKLILNNGASANKALGVIGGFGLSEGDFKVSGTLVAYFSTIAAINAIRNNLDVCLQTIFAKANAGQVWDVPLLTLGGGNSKVVKDKPIMVDLTQDAAKAVGGYTMGVTIFEYLPTVAMPI